MDKLSDFIPLLIIIGSIIISIVQSSNKKKEERDMKKMKLPKGIPSERPPGAPVVNLPKMKSTVASIYEKTREKPKSDFTSFNPEVKRSTLSGSISSIPDMQILNSEVSEDQGFKLNLTDVDEVKKAVIYSEIFNRKEY
jgi:hypothetical protein